jgi:hypothetical protein
MSEITIDTDLSVDEPIETELLDGETVDCDVSEQVKVGEGNNDYEKLRNLPSINNQKLIGNYDEQDPTVPEWAKTERKPTYTADELNAMDNRNEMSFADIKEIWDRYFQ